jgi:flagellar hook assembly protein FlgD
MPPFGSDGIAPNIPRTWIEQDRRTLMTESAVFHYELVPEDAGFVTLTISDLVGREVRTLVNEPLAAGAYESAWDRKDDSGKRVRTGVYYYELRTRDRRLAKRVVVVM